MTGCFISATSDICTAGTVGQHEGGLPHSCRLSTGCRPCPQVGAESVSSSSPLAMPHDDDHPEGSRGVKRRNTSFAIHPSQRTYTEMGTRDTVHPVRTGAGICTSPCDDTNEEKGSCAKPVQIPFTLLHSPRRYKNGRRVVYFV